MELNFDQALPYIASAAVLWIAWRLLRRLLRPKGAPEHMETRACPACGFSGAVSRHAPKCRKCGAHIPRQVIEKS